MRHIEMLKRIEMELRTNASAVSLLVFGSVAQGMHHEDSDIDLIVVYQAFTPGYEFSTDIKCGIKIGFSRWSLDELRYNILTVPYLMFVFGSAHILFDREGKVRCEQRKIQEYLEHHPEVKREWAEYNNKYEAEKQQFGVGQTSIVDVLDALEQKFSQGTRKRTFLLQHPIN